MVKNFGKGSNLMIKIVKDEVFQFDFDIWLSHGSKFKDITLDVKKIDAIHILYNDMITVIPHTTDIYIIDFSSITITDNYVTVKV